MNAKDKDKNQAEEQDKGFAVHDKRRIGKEDLPEEEPQAPDTPTEQPAKTDRDPDAAPRKAETQETTSTEPENRTPEEARTETETPPRTGERSYVPLTFTSFIMSLSTSALIYLGQVPDPISGKTVKDLVGARQTIDLISLLREKTKGNLTTDEEAFVDTILYDLRMLFVKANA